MTVHCVFPLGDLAVVLLGDLAVVLLGDLAVVLLGDRAVVLLFARDEVVPVSPDVAPVCLDDVGPWSRVPGQDDSRSLQIHYPDFLSWLKFGQVPGAVASVVVPLLTFDPRFLLLAELVFVWQAGFQER